MDQVFQLKITLDYIEPPIWRQLETHDCTLAELHDIIQVAFGWEDYHMWDFEVAGEHFSLPEALDDLEWRDASQTKLSDLVAGGVKKFAYTYDMGDNWQHAIKIENAVAAEPKAKYPRCLAGARSGPPEDCGGPWGYGDMLEAIADPKHEQHDELLEWIGGKFDPEKFSVEQINKGLRKIR